jgi:hypothetical protein
MSKARAPNRQALRHKDNKAIRRAAKAFGLDSNKPVDRERLLAILAGTLFPVHADKNSASGAYRRPVMRGARGRPVKWNRERVDRVETHIKSLPPEWFYDSALGLAKRLKEAFRSDYADIDLMTLTKYLRQGLPGHEIRKPVLSAELTREQAANWLEEVAEVLGRAMTPAQAKKVEAWIREFVKRLKEAEKNRGEI